MTLFREVPIIKMLSCGLPGGLPEYVDSGTERVQHGSSCLSTEPALQVNDSLSLDGGYLQQHLGGHGGMFICSLSSIQKRVWISLCHLTRACNLTLNRDLQHTAMIAHLLLRTKFTMPQCQDLV